MILQKISTMGAYFSCAVSLLMYAPSTYFSTAHAATLSLSFDNDSFLLKDKDYTHGLFIQYTSSPLAKQHKLHWLSLASKTRQGSTDHQRNCTKQQSTHTPCVNGFYPTSNHPPHSPALPSTDKWGIEISQQIWTPNWLSYPIPIKDQRPYAGVLQLTTNYLSIQEKKAQQFSLSLGTMGEHSYAEQGQKKVHSVIKSVYPRGWKYQVQQPLIATFSYLRNQSLHTSENAWFQWQVINSSEFKLGNFRNEASTGFLIKVGSDLGSSIGAQKINRESPILPSMIINQQPQWLGFVGGRYLYRFTDSTLDTSKIDNSPIKDHALNIRHSQATAVLGAMVYNQSLGVSFSMSVNTKEYHQAHDSLFYVGNINLFIFL